MIGECRDGGRPVASGVRGRPIGQCPGRREVGVGAADDRHALLGEQPLEVDPRGLAAAGNPDPHHRCSHASTYPPPCHPHPAANRPDSSLDPSSLHPLATASSGGGFIPAISPPHVKSLSWDVNPLFSDFSSCRRVIESRA